VRRARLIVARSGRPWPLTAEDESLSRPGRQIDDGCNVARQERKLQGDFLPIVSAAVKGKDCLILIFCGAILLPVVFLQV